MWASCGAKGTNTTLRADVYIFPAMLLQGVCTIALTPFSDNGDVDEAGIGSLSELFMDAGVHGVTVLGIMGEAHKLSDAERALVMERYLSAIAGRVPVVVGCSAPGTRVATERAREAEAAGAAAVMVAPPNNVGNLDLVFEHYRRVAEAVSVPVVVQDEPVNTGVVMPAPFLARLADEIEGCRGAATSSWRRRRPRSRPPLCCKRPPRTSPSSAAWAGCTSSRSSRAAPQAS